jgi:hypothetical protein
MLTLCQHATRHQNMERDFWAHSSSTHRQPQKNCSNTVDRVAMSQKQNSNDMQFSTAMVLLNVQNISTYVAQLLRISVIRQTPRFQWISWPPMSLTSKHCQQEHSLIRHGKGIKFSYSKNITRLHGKRQIYENGLKYQVLEKYEKNLYYCKKKQKVSKICLYAKIS